jgi:hypothetical protein
MHPPPKLNFDLSQLGAEALRDGSPLYLKASPSRLPADVRKA